MLRWILGVVVGYIAMFVFVFATFSGAYVLLGTSGAFKPGSFEPSGTWILLSFVLGFVAAVVGGLVCAAIARSSQAVLGLAGLVLVLGLIVAVPVLWSEPGTATRDEDLSNVEAMRNAQQPGWVALLNPFVGAAGVLLGGRLKRVPASRNETT